MLKLSEMLQDAEARGDGKLRIVMLAGGDPLTGPLDEAPKVPRGTEGIAAGATFVATGGERMTPGDGTERRFVAKDNAGDDSIAHVDETQLGIARWVVHMATTTPSEPGLLKDGETIFGPTGGGKTTVAESIAALEALKAARDE